MCIAAWVWVDHPGYHFLLVHNRDEFHDRPAKPVAWWEGSEREMILGGRDGKAGGTWLGCTRNGRLSFVTNVRDLESFPCPKSRGDLPVRFLQSKKSPQEFAAEIAVEAGDFNGFNLVVADLSTKTMVYMTNRPKGDPLSVQVVCPGIHVLSNARLDTPWPKAQRLRRSFEDMLSKNADGEDVCWQEAADRMMVDKVRADVDQLPSTGFDVEWEHQLSSIFVEADTESGRYGTRSTAVVSVKTSGEVGFHEKYLENGSWKEHFEKFILEEKVVE